MRLDEAADIRLGERAVSRVMLGEAQVWPVSERARLDVSPGVIWLPWEGTPAQVVNVDSNTSWNVS